ncbi:MAG: DUF2142 domain-containing protein [Oscillospiraceae bacterium]
MKNFLNNVKKRKHILFSIIIFFACLAIFALVYKFNLTDITQKSRSFVLNDSHLYYTDAVKSGESITQRFAIPQDINSLHIFTNVDNCYPDDIVKMSVINAEENRVISTLSCTADKMLTDTYCSFVFQQPLIFSQCANYDLVINFESTNPANSISFGCSETPPNDMWKLSINGIPSCGALTMSASVDKIGGFIRNFYFVLSLLFALTLSFTYLTIFVFRLPIHYISFIIIMMLGMLYSIIFPPYAAPDEVFHINQSFNNSSIILGQVDKSDIVWGTNYKRPSDFNDVIEARLTTVYTYREIVDNLFVTSPDNATDVKLFKSEEVGGYNIPYILSGVIISICRIFHIGYIPTLLIARFANLLMYAILASFAVKFMPYSKSAMAICSILPMSLHLASSFSRDCFIISFSFLFIGMCLYAIESKEKLSNKFFLLLAFVSIILAPSKSAYVPICLIILAIPTNVFKSKAAMRYTKIGTLFFTAANYLYANGSLIFNVLRQPVVQTVSSAALEITTSNPDSITFSLGYILKFPGIFISLLVNTIMTNGEFYLKTLIGGNLGYFNTDLSWVFVIGFIVLLFVAFQRTDSEQSHMTTWGFCWIQLMALSVCALVVMGCVLWTPTYYKTIYGIQGRYFLPILPILLLFLKNKHLVTKQDIDGFLMFTSVVLNAFVLLNSFIVIAGR